jgi:hypothetical protein
MDRPLPLRRTDVAHQTTNGDEIALAAAKAKHAHIRRRFEALVQDIIVDLNLQTGHEGPGDLSKKVAREIERLLEHAQVD